MPLQFDYEAGGLTVRSGSRLFLERKEPMFQAIAAEIQERQPKATLVDLWNIPGPVTFLDRYELGELAGRYLPNLILAVLVRPEHVDAQRIGQVVARNRGAHVEIITDPAAAEAWLKSQLTPEP